MAPFQCLPESITSKKTWPYFERYHGKKDEENRRTGHGEYYWSNADSLESYEGPFFRDTMHGCGTYRWRWLGEEGDHISYEGYFFTNKMHGYGTMSYPDGRTFAGLFCNDLRWGPGIMRHVNRRADIGFWRGNQLIRLSWRPPTISLVPDIAGCLFGPHFLEQFRIILHSHKKTVTETNSVLDILKNQGMVPSEAAEKRLNVYSKYCTDMESILCHKSEFYKSYYGDTIHTLEESTPEKSTMDKMSRKAAQVASHSFTHEENIKEYHYAWNNDPVILHMMKHAFQHDYQRPAALDLALLLGGPRHGLPTPGSHELDCRTTLMACYLGDKSTVLSMIQEDNVHPNIADMQGNTALMYATCGNQIDIIHYLVEAGAPVDVFNDACFTPLCVALLIYNLIKYNVPLLESANVLMKSSSFQLERPEPVVTDWLITRTLPTLIPHMISQPKTGLSSASMKKIKSQASMRAVSSIMTKKRLQSKKSLAQGNFTSATDLESEEGMHYRSTLHEYEMRINTLMHIMGSPEYPRYLFTFRNMMIDVESLKTEEDQRTISKTSTGRGTSRGTIRGTVRGTITGNSNKELKAGQVKETKSNLKINRSESKFTRDITWQHSEKDDNDNLKKTDSLNSAKLTIIHLLMEGANPRLVRCPQPALVLAIIAGNTEILNQLIRFGADVNERYPKLYGYTPLQFAVSRPFSTENNEIIKTLLENGAKANDRLLVPPTSTTEMAAEGPTLIHALIGRSTTSDAEDDLRKETMELLLQHGCDAYAFYQNRSAIDYVMEQSLELLDVFINSDTVVLNGSTNAQNQSMLAKLLSAECFINLPATRRYQTLSNLLIFGADPLLPVKYDSYTYENILVYAKHELEELKIIPHEGKIRKKSELKISTSKRKSLDKSSRSRVTSITVESDYVVDYTKCIEMVTEGARMLQIRWIQSNLVKELIEVIVSKRPGTPWHIIMREHKNEKRTNLWLNAPRCLEIWEILRQAKHPIIKSTALRPLLAIVHYYNERNALSPKLIFKEKEAIDKYVDNLINEPKGEIPGRWPWRRRYTTPELSSSKAKKFKICFECSLPLSWSKVECEFCNLVFFCSWECMGKNARGHCHPCSTSLAQKYFHEASVRGEGSELHVIHEEVDG